MLAVGQLLGCSAWSLDSYYDFFARFQVEEEISPFLGIFDLIVLRKLYGKCLYLTVLFTVDITKKKKNRIR